MAVFTGFHYTFYTSVVCIFRKIFLIPLLTEWLTQEAFDTFFTHTSTVLVVYRRDIICAVPHFSTYCKYKYIKLSLSSYNTTRAKIFNIRSRINDQ